MSQDLWPLYRRLVPQGDDPEPTDKVAQQLREQIIVDNVHLAEMVVKKMKKSMPRHVEGDDLESWAKIGLMQAVRRYNHEIGVPFGAFANQRMRSVIMDAIRDADWAPRSLRKRQRDITTAEEQLRISLGQEPTEEQIASKLGLTVDELSDARYAIEIATHTYIEEQKDSHGVPSAALSMDEAEMVNDLKFVLAEGLRSLSPRKATIVALHYYKNMKLAAIAKELRTTEAKVGAIHKEAVLELWARFESVLKAV